MTYRPLPQPCANGCGRPAEHGYWQRTPDGTTHHYCWLCFDRVIRDRDRDD